MAIFFCFDLWKGGDSIGSLRVAMPEIVITTEYGIDLNENNNYSGDGVVCFVHVLLRNKDEQIILDLFKTIHKMHKVHRYMQDVYNMHRKRKLIKIW